MVCTHAFAIWNICKNKKIRILIISKALNQTRKFIRAIKNELLQNELLIRDFGPFKTPESSWTDTYFYVPENKQKDPTIEGCGVQGAITGGRFDLIIADDIVDDENTRTAERMKGVENWFFGTIRPLAEPWTRMLAVGTRKHYLDIYNTLLNNPIWKVHKDKAILKYPDKYEYVEDEEGNIIDIKTEGEWETLWPSKWGIKELLELKKDMGSILFEREEQNDPSGMRGQMLHLEWLHFYTTDMSKTDIPHLPSEFKYKFIGVDLAISDKPDADFFALAVVGICKNNYWWLLDIYRNKLEFPEQVAIIERYSQMHNPIRVYIESNAYQAAIVQHMQRFSAAPVLPRRTTRDKVTRMLALSPFFESGKIKVRDTMQDFVTEWLHFPKGEHDDMLDAVEIATNDIRNPAYSSSSVSGVRMKDTKLFDKTSGQMKVEEVVKHFKRQGSKGHIFKL